MLMSGSRTINLSIQIRIAMTDPRVASRIDGIQYHYHSSQTERLREFWKAPKST